jgi:GNAT superfamily N-acetyltransferase
VTTAAATVRQAGPEDLAALAELRRASAREQDGERPDPGFETDFAAWFERERAHRVFWLAERDGGPVGSMNLMVFERMPRPGRGPGRWGYLGNAFVLAAHRNQGVGQRLLDAILDHAAREGLVRVVLSPSERSIPFYRRAGFRAADELLVWTPGAAPPD